MTQKFSYISDFCNKILVMKYAVIIYRDFTKIKKNTMPKMNSVYLCSYNMNILGVILKETLVISAEASVQTVNEPPSAASGGSSDEQVHSEAKVCSVVTQVCSII